ncbi:MAG: OsmC family peroxiredoxin [Sporocytophaga sp.]|jgi:osmotically inducible protein OsmC|nr:OsmC family peroxiredoxin [Sporocytophaga sp.]
MIRTANAAWKGDLKSGTGSINTESGLVKDATYNFARRFENEKGTNPEELLGAAHAACFAMALSHGLASAGFTPVKVNVEDKVKLEKVGDGFSITTIEINCIADVPGISESEFLKFAEDTKKGCPVSKALTGVNFILNAKLKSGVSA